MEDSPLVSPIIKEYCAKFEIENVLNSAINEVMLKMPPDPFSLFCTILKKVII
jgi:hypothetical protein